MTARAARTLPAGASRRPLRSREAPWAVAVALWLAARRVPPNLISVTSVAFAALSGACLVLTGPAGSGAGVALYGLAAAGIQLRLLCNLLDGMVAVEGGLRTPTGELYNEVPDRVADVLVLVAAGYATLAAAWQPGLGWAAATLAVTTAYVRALGVALGTRPQFCGPMAKPQRMAVMTAACLAAGVEVGLGGTPRAMAAALALVVAGCIATIVRRTVAIARELESGRGASAGSDG